jgi:hypothetical protein
MRKGFLIYEEIRKYFPIYDEAVSNIWLCNCSILNFLIYEENLFFFFISVLVLWLWFYLFLFLLTRGDGKLPVLPFFAYIEGKRGGNNDRKSFNSIFVTEIVTLYIRIELLLPPYHIPIAFFSQISIYPFFLSSFLILITSFLFKGTQAWEFFGLWFWNLYFFVVSYA